MACSILDYIPYGNGRIGVFECSIVSGIPISWSSRFLDPLDKMPLVARGHVTYLILNYWTQPTNPKDWNSITQKSDSVKCDFMVVWMTQKIRCINGKVAGSHALWSYIFFPFKNLPNFTGIRATKISESLVSVISKLIFSTLFLSLVWYCLSCIPYFLHKAGQVVRGLIELIHFSPDFSNLPTCYSFSLTTKYLTTGFIFLSGEGGKHLLA